MRMHAYSNRSPFICRLEVRENGVHRALFGGLAIQNKILGPRSGLDSDDDDACESKWLRSGFQGSGSSSEMPIHVASKTMLLNCES